MNSDITIALAGNPNAGKTTLFNALTGARQHVGNYPGVTVEKKEGFYPLNGSRLRIVDLPGTYSLTAYSMEEVVARDFLVNERPALVIDIVDASNLERNLYLTVQFMELGVPLMIALNMMDMAESRGMMIDLKKLSSLLDVPVVPTVARIGKGKQELMETVRERVNREKADKLLHLSYGGDLDQAILEMEKEVRCAGFMTDKYPARWVALKYLESDEQIIRKGEEANPSLSKRLQSMVQQVSNHLLVTTGNSPEAVIADHRYGYIHSILKQGIMIRKHDQDRLYHSDKIDKVVTHRFFGPVVLFLVIFGLYHFTFTYSKIPVGWFEKFFSGLSRLASTYLPEGHFKSLVVSGVIDGVGGVLGFVPLIMMMFFGISILEDSGYLARMAFMLDRVFSFFGLHGSSVMAFIISGGIAGGCAVPGVMATRTLRSRRERLATLLTAPFMNCGAKLPVFALLIAAFFKENEAVIMVMITLVSWGGALLVAKFLRLTIIRGEPTPFVMELPPYRLPMLKGLIIHTWERTWQYMRKAGTVILGISVILWALMTFPGLPEDHRNQSISQEDSQTSVSAKIDGTDQTQSLKPNEAEALKYSIAGRIGTGMEKISHLAGFDWRVNIALLGGFAAKEIVVSTLGTAYSLGEADPENSPPLSEKLSGPGGWRPLTGLSLLIFTMFYTPCFATVICISREAGSWKWGAFSMAFNTVLAFILAVAVFQIGSAIGY
ncbi:MAG: ferrous iron transport protein B [Thermodesulfobacteriota bacterium]